MGDATCFIPAEKGNNRGFLLSELSMQVLLQMYEGKSGTYGYQQSGGITEEAGGCFFCVCFVAFFMVKRNIVKISNYMLQTLQFRIIMMIL